MPELVVPAVSDAGRIAAALNARSLAFHGVSEESSEGVARWFGYPELDAAADMRLALDTDGTVLGYADVSGPEDTTSKAWVDLRTLPDSPEALELLFAWAEARASERAGPTRVTQYFVDERDDPLRAVLAAAGYAVVRSSFEMKRALEDELAAPSWPEGIVAEPFQEAHAEAVHAAHDEAFRDHWGYEPESYEHWRAHNLSDQDDTSLWRIAWDAAAVVGLCINRPSRGEDDTVGWVGVLAVRRPWRRRGLGEALLRESFRAFAACGKRSVGLGVDAENTTGAVALYERVGMHVFRRSDTWERSG